MVAEVVGVLVVSRVLAVLAFFLALIKLAAVLAVLAVLAFFLWLLVGLGLGLATLGRGLVLTVCPHL
jgi:hypothetical protein